MKYVINNPKCKGFGSGGFVLYKLYEQLESLGEDVYLANNWGWRNQGCWSGIDYKYFERDGSGDFVAIYTNRDVANPLNAKHVVRWMLHHPGYRTGNYRHPHPLPRHSADHKYVRAIRSWNLDTDLIFSWIDYYTYRAEKLGYEVAGNLTVTHTHFDEYKDLGLARSGSSYTMRKGTYHNKPWPDYVPKDAVPIEPDRFPDLAPRIAEKFNQYEYFYSFDHGTWMSITAALCGCVSVVVPRKDTTAELWYKLLPHYKYGVAYGKEYIDHAKETLPLMRDYLMSLEKKNIDTVKDFVTITKERFGQ